MGARLQRTGRFVLSVGTAFALYYIGLMAGLLVYGLVSLAFFGLDWDGGGQSTRAIAEGMLVLLPALMVGILLPRAKWSWRPELAAALGSIGFIAILVFLDSGVPLWGGAALLTAVAVFALLGARLRLGSRPFSPPAAA